jgi:hypothetical protein
METPKKTSAVRKESGKAYHQANSDIDESSLNSPTKTPQLQTMNGHNAFEDVTQEENKRYLDTGSWILKPFFCWAYKVVCLTDKIKAVEAKDL